MAIMASNISCGVRQMTDIQGIWPSSIAYAVLLQKQRGNGRRFNGAFFIFSDNNIAENRRAITGGMPLAKFLFDNELGDIYETELRHNPSSGNRIRMWIYDPDQTALENYFRRNPLTPIQLDDANAFGGRR